MCLSDRRKYGTRLLPEHGIEGDPENAENFGTSLKQGANSKCN
jgi:hypothetical protein